MRLRVASAQRVTVGPAAGSGPVVAAVPLAALALVPLLASSGPISALAAGALFALAATCLCLGRIWPARVDIFPRQRELVRRGRHVSFDQVESLALAAALGSPAGSYEVRVHLRGGCDWLLLSGLNPAQVLRELGEVVSHTGLAVAQGWGMPPDAQPWLEPSAEAGVDAACSRLGTTPLSWGPQSSQPLVVMSVKIAAALTSTIIAAFAMVRLAEGKSIGALSLTLASGLVLLLLGVAAAVALERIQVEGDDPLVVRIRSWGWTREVAAIARTDLFRAYSVQAVTRRHLLLETRSGPIAIPLGASEPLESVLACDRRVDRELSEHAIAPSRGASAVRP